MNKEKERILKRYIKDLLHNINFNNYNACKRIIDNIKKLKESDE
jgi:hypothetical protein